MNPGRNSINYLTGRKFSALLFAVGILFLLVSCPVKRILQGSFSFFAGQQQNNRANIIATGTAHYANDTSCCSLKEKTALHSTHLSETQISSPFIPVADKKTEAFSISYFLSRIRQAYRFPARTDLSAIPLFLQHRSMLI